MSHTTTTWRAKMKPPTLEEFQLMVETLCATHTPSELQALFVSLNISGRSLKDYLYWAAYRKTDEHSNYPIKEWLYKPYNDYLKQGDDFEGCKTPPALTRIRT